MLVDRYLARNIASPMIATVAVTFMLLVLEELSRLLTMLSHTGAPALLALRMLAFLFPEYLALAIPISLLLGVLLAFLKLKRRSELDVLCTSRLTFDRLLLVPYGFALVAFLAGLLIVGFLQPIASYKFERLGSALDSGAFGARVRDNDFTRLGPHFTMRVEQVQAGPGPSLSGVFFADQSDDGSSLAGYAPRGSFLRDAITGELVVELSDGRLVHMSPNKDAFGAMSFRVVDIPVTLPAIREFRSRGAIEDEMTLGELLYRWDNPRIDANTRRAATTEINGRAAELAFTMLLPMLAAALSAPTRRRDSAAPILIGILIVVTFHKANQYSEHVSGALLSPVAAVWILFASFALLIIWMYLLTSRQPGADPLLWFHRFSDAFWAISRHLLVHPKTMTRS